MCMKKLYRPVQTPQSPLLQWPGGEKEVCVCECMRECVYVCMVCVWVVKYTYTQYMDSLNVRVHAFCGGEVPINIPQ